MPLCALCGRDGTYKCSRCGEAFYCSADHQREAWRLGHKTACNKNGAGEDTRATEVATLSANTPSQNDAFEKLVESSPCSLRNSGAVAKSTCESPAAEHITTGASSRLKDGMCMYINLDRRSDRRARIENLFASHTWLGGAMKRIPGVDGHTLSWSNLVKDRLITEEAFFEARRAADLQVPTMTADVEECNTHLTLGGCGCALSHQTAWQAIVDSGVRWGLVMEDDIVSICDCFDGALEEVLAQLPVGWQVCYLGYHAATGQDRSPLQLPSGKHFVGPLLPLREGWIAGLYAYLVSKQGAKALLEKAVPFAGQVDAVVGCVAIPANRCYAVKPGEFLAYSPPTEVSRDTDVQTFQEDLE